MQDCKRHFLWPVFWRQGLHTPINNNSAPSGTGRHHRFGTSWRENNLKLITVQDSRMCPRARASTTLRGGFVETGYEKIFRFSRQAALADLVMPFIQVGDF
jgi:hypothetical protein